MEIPLFNLKRQYKSIKSEIDRVVQKVIDEQKFVLGDEVDRFEDEVNGYCRTKYAVGVASGTDALILALKALGIKEGDEVLTTPFTFFATAEAISHVRAKPVFVDIDPRTYNIDPGLIEGKITASTKAIIPVHLYGQCADMDNIINIARRNGLKVIEDAAQAIGATYKGKKAGSMADAGTLSFFPSKNLGGFGDGGMLLTGDSSLSDKVRMLRVHGSSATYKHSAIGMNSRLDSIQAAVLRVKLKYLDKWLQARRETAEYYNENFKDLPLAVPYVPDGNVHTYHLYILRCGMGASGIMKYLTQKGIETRTYYPVPLHLQECYKELGYKEGDMPESEKCARENFALPVFPEMTGEEKEYVAKTVKGYFKK